MISLRRILMVLLLPMVSLMKLSAEEDLLWLPEYFERVQELSDVEDGAYYLIAGVSQQEGHVLMTTELVNKKFKGVVAPQQERIFCEDATHVWQIHRSGNEVILRAVASGLYLYVPKSNKPEVELQSNSYTAWELQQKEDGFVLKNPSEQLRYLHTSRQSSADNPNPFGNYSFYEGTAETNLLYLYKLDVDYTAPTDNTVTYLTDGDKVPVYGNLIVRDGALLYPSVLLDALDFKPTQSFTVASGQLSYTRTLQDDNWETLALPFAANVPDGIDARELVSVEGGTLSFQPVTQIRPHVPVIIKSTGEAGMQVTFVSKACTVVPLTEVSSLMVPVYQFFEVNSAAEGIYLLTSDGQTFTLSDSGSRLRPFRGYVRMEE